MRNRIAARAAALKLQTLTPFFGSLERDPVHHSVYYLAVDSDTEPLLLHMALAAAPTSSIYYKPLLDRTHAPSQRVGDGDQRDSVRPARPSERGDLCRAHQSGLLSEAPGCTNHNHGGGRLPRGLRTFRAIQKRTGKNFAAFAGDYHAAMCAAIRAGWRSGYTAATELGAGTDLNGRERFSRYAVTIPAGANGIEDAEKVIQQIRQARAALKISRGFDLELDAATPMTPLVLRNTMEGLKDRGHVPQLIYPGPFAEKELDEMAAIASHYQVTLSFRYGGEPAETVRTIAKAMAGRLDYRVRDAAEAKFVAEQLL